MCSHILGYSWLKPKWDVPEKNPQGAPSWSWAFRCQYSPLKLFNISCLEMDRFAYACEKDPYTKSLTANHNFLKKDVHTKLMNNPYSWSMLFTNCPLSKQKSSMNICPLLVRSCYFYGWFIGIFAEDPRTTWDTFSHKLPTPFPYEPRESHGSSSGLLHVLMGFLWDSYDYGTGDFQPFPKQICGSFTKHFR